MQEITNAHRIKIILSDLIYGAFFIIIMLHAERSMIENERL